ncbi:MAG: nucleoside monophosphate kinase [Patescibacteria group bacterium]
MSPHAFIFVGRSGSGKGTQVSLLLEVLKQKDPTHKIFTVETGKELRKFIEGDTFTQKLAHKIQASGGFQPSFLAIYNWSKVFIDTYEQGMHMVLDGTSRRLPEAIALDSVFDFYGIAKCWVVYLDIHDEEATNRLLARGRADDTHEGIKNRLSGFEQDMKPSIEFFRNNKRYDFLDINGIGKIDDIHADIISKLGLK